MSTKKLRRMFAIVNVAIIVTMVANLVLPVIALASGTPNDPYDLKGHQPSAMYQLLKNRGEIEEFATVVASAIQVNDDGTLSLDAAVLGEIEPAKSQVLHDFVNDINAKEIGIAVHNQDGTTKVYGSEKALTEGVPLQSDFQKQSVGGVSAQVAPQAPQPPSPTPLEYGERTLVSYWINDEWTDRLFDAEGWVIGIIAGALVTLVCTGTVVFCWSVGTITSFLIHFVVWKIIRAMGPDSITLHFTSHFRGCVQPWKSGWIGWYDGLLFCTPHL
ncbi:MAG: hypothetical protein GY762_19870 [Proteobacteria bacterium]|nr:hypothetical protein [Pseudomonadota bacterium]